LCFFLFRIQSNNSNPKKMLENDSSSTSLSSVGAVEFQVVLLAGGPGSRMSPLSTEIPKPLLPIANRPMISYQLEFLERAGFSGACTCLQRGGSIAALRCFHLLEF
jgi:hypothetical protein